MLDVLRARLLVCLFLGAVYAAIGVVGFAAQVALPHLPHHGPAAVGMVGGAR